MRVCLRELCILQIQEIQCPEGLQGQKKKEDHQRQGVQVRRNLKHRRLHIEVLGVQSDDAWQREMREIDIDLEK